jgi:acetyl esterase/lipase
MHSSYRGIACSLIATLVLLLALSAGCQKTVSAPVAPKAPAPQVLRLWQGDAPGALGKEDKDIPTLTIYPADPAKATGAAMVIFPGGGYAILSDFEGEGYAKWLNRMGIAGFVVKYRLGTDGYRHPCMLQDAQRAVRMVRANAKEWNVDPKRVGVIGSSAGGHMVAMLATHFDKGNPDAADPIERQSCRPDLGVLCYPVISMDKYIHRGSKKFLIGENPSQALIDETSADKNVRPDTPPCFLWHSGADEAVPVQNSLLFAAALQNAKVPYDLHIYTEGEHGIGLGADVDDPDNFHPWTIDCHYWLKVMGFLKKPMP